LGQPIGRQVGFDQSGVAGVLLPHLAGVDCVSGHADIVAEGW
jgi:hypothetical protein